MILFISTVQAELLKLRRTLAFWLVFLGPLFVVVLSFWFDLTHPLTVQGADVNAWQTLIGDTVMFWAVLMLPMFVVLETALLGQLEHNAKAWKQLYAQPVPRWTFYFAKWLVGFLLIAAAYLVLITGTVAAGLTTQWLGMAPHFHWITFFPNLFGLIWLPSMMLVLSLLMISLHTYLGLRWSNFTVAIGLGILASIIGYIGIAVNRMLIADFIPWAMPFHAAMVYTKGAPAVSLVLPFLISCGGTILVTLFGAWDVSRQDVL